MLRNIRLNIVKNDDGEEGIGIPYETTCKMTGEVLRHDDPPDKLVAFVRAHPDNEDARVMLAMATGQDENGEAVEVAVAIPEGAELSEADKAWLIRGSFFRQKTASESPAAKPRWTNTETGSRGSSVSLRLRCAMCGYVSVEVTDDSTGSTAARSAVAPIFEHVERNRGHAALLEEFWNGEWAPGNVAMISADNKKAHYRLRREPADPAARVSMEAVEGGENMDFDKCCKCGASRDLAVVMYGSPSWILALASKYGVKVARASALMIVGEFEEEHTASERYVPLCRSCAPKHWVPWLAPVAAVEPGMEERFAKSLAADEKTRQALAAGGEWYGGFYTDGEHEIVEKGIFATRREAEAHFRDDKPGWALRCVQELPSGGVVESWPDDREAKLIPARTVCRQPDWHWTNPERRTAEMTDPEFEAKMKEMATCDRCEAERPLGEMFIVVPDVPEVVRQRITVLRVACPRCAANWGRSGRRSRPRAH